MASLEKVIRDPVHDVIAFRMASPVDRLMFRLINAAEFQRLRRVRQLGLASLAYPGADHSRYSHSLGVMQTARRMLDRLRLFFTIDPEQEALCVVGALLHDLGHGPFSHVFERVSGIDHERVTHRLILDPDSHVHEELESFDRQMPEKLVRFLQCNPARTFYNDILSSQLDADRFDYLLRDNLMTGSQYGGFDLGWLLQSLTIHQPTDRLAVTWKGISAVEDYLQSRYQMYKNVYFHKVVRSAEGMVRLALQRARRLAMQDRLNWPPREHTVHRALLGQALGVRDFTDLDDVSMLHSFKLWAEGDDPTLAALCRGLLFRRLFKVIDLSHVADAGRVQQIVLAVEQAVRSAGGDADYDVFLDQPADTPYEQYPQAACGEDGIHVQAPDGALTDFTQLSPLVQALNRQLQFHRLHVAEEWRELARAEVARVGTT